MLSNNLKNFESFVENIQASVPQKEKAFQKTETLLDKVFDDPVDFVKTLWDDAVAVAKQLNLDPKVLIAQAALETGWGKSVIRDGSGSSFNLFNIKADKSWAGDKISKHTLEYNGERMLKTRAPFRRYDAFSESFKDYLDFLQGNPRYQNTLSETNDPKAFLESLQAAGYAHRS